MSYNIGDRLEVKIEKIVPNGLGMAFAEKLTVFVPLAVAGDTLEIELRQIQGRTAFGAIIKILKPAPERIEPPCVYFGKCGGCDFQQMDYKAQLEAKKGIITDCLSRIGHINWELDIPITPSIERFGYRLRTQFHANGRGQLGFFRRLTHDIIDIEHCEVLTPAMNGVLRALREYNSNREYEGVVDVEAAAFEFGTSIYSEDIEEPADEVSVEVLGERFFFSAKSFFQANEKMLEALVKEAVAGFEGMTAIDFYCGAGLFSVPLAKNFERVFGVESNSDSIGFARKNRDTARIENLEFYEGRVKEFLKKQQGKKADFVLIDPPRSGVKTATLKRIAGICTGNMNYVSCNPSTLARDLRVLLDEGFEIRSINAIDMFPQTHHVETIVKLSRLQSRMS